MYEYLIYKLFKWAKSKDEVPVGTVIITLTMTHFFQFLSLLNIISGFFPAIKLYNFRYDKIIYGVGALLFGVCLYFLLYNKEKWNELIEKYKHEPKKIAFRRSIYVLIYLIGSIALYFVTLFIFDFMRNR